jgi:hypothetical protein
MSLCQQSLYMSKNTTETLSVVSCDSDYDKKTKESMVEIHPEQLFEVILETETLNGIPVQTMTTLINFESLVANLYRATRVHARTHSQFGSLPLETIFKPVLSGCLCKGVCHMEDVATVIRVMVNCLSRCSFVDHQCIKHLHNEMLHSTNAMPPWSDFCTDDVKKMLKEYNKIALIRVTNFLRKLNEEMYDWRGFVRKPLPKKAPFNMYDITPTTPYVTVKHDTQEKVSFGCVSSILFGINYLLCNQVEQANNRTMLY